MTSAPRSCGDRLYGGKEGALGGGGDALGAVDEAERPPPPPLMK